MGLISSAPEINTLAAQADTTAGLYFVTAFNGLLAPYWDPGAGGLMIGTYDCSVATYLFVVRPVSFQCRPESIHNTSSHCSRDARSERVPDAGDPGCDEARFQSRLETS